jgi:hypothetical protein
MRHDSASIRFLAAVTGHAPTAEQADAVIGRRLSALRSGVVSL